LFSTTLTIDSQSDGLYNDIYYYKDSDDNLMNFSSGIYIPDMGYTITQRLQGTVGNQLM